MPRDNKKIVIMKYVIEKVDTEDWIILLEDGGVGTIHSNGDNWIATTFQDRIDTPFSLDNDWGKLSEGKVYEKDFSFDTNLSDIATYIVNWLCVGCNAKVGGEEI